MVNDDDDHVSDDDEDDVVDFSSHDGGGGLHNTFLDVDFFKKPIKMMLVHQE